MKKKTTNKVAAARSLPARGNGPKPRRNALRHNQCDVGFSRGLLCACCIVFATMVLFAEGTEAWRIEWQDEFDGPKINQSVWSFEEGFLRNNEPQYYTGERTENACLEDGKLVITARKEKWKNRHYMPNGPTNNMAFSVREANYTSASLLSKGKFDFMYGKLEVRARIPEALGTWPAIWTCGSKFGWPKCGENDIMEANGSITGAISSATHWAHPKTGKHITTWKELSGISPSNGFHIYGMEWDENKIDYFYDGQLYRTQSIVDLTDESGFNPFRQPHYLRLNLAIWDKKGIDDSAFPLRYEIDYVRLYRRSGHSNEKGTVRTDKDIQAIVDANVGGVAVLPPGQYEISKTVLLPSHTSLMLGGCRLRMKDGVIAPMFRNIVDANGDAKNVVIDGCGSCVLDGGEPNGLNEFTSRKNGMPSVRENLTMSFTGVDGFAIRNLTIKDQRWWAMAFVECCNGSISNIEFQLTRHKLDSRAQWRNQDGIDLRVGCHDIAISDIRGETGDDMIALTALEEESCRPGHERDIRNISIRRVRGRTNQCALIRLLSHFGQAVHDIDIEDIVEDSVPGQHNQTQMAVRIGDRIPPYYRHDPANAQRFGDIRDIRVNGLVTRALTAVHTDDSVKNMSVRNVRLFGDGGSVWTAGAFGISVSPFIYIPERENEVRSSTLLPRKRGDTPRYENITFDDVSVESRPHSGEAAFRFNNVCMEQCCIGNVRLAAGRRMVEEVDCHAVESIEWQTNKVDAATR